MLLSMSPLWETLLAVHHHILLLIKPRGSHSIYKYITILHSTSPLRDTLLTLHHHILQFNQTRGSGIFYKYINILHSTPPLWDTLLAGHNHILLLIRPPWVTLLLQVHCHTALYVSAMGHTAGSTLSYHILIRPPWATLLLLFYKSITILHSTSQL